jgi:hypothetical protein
MNPAARLARTAAASVFAIALFASAALIFVLQPLFARMVTPLLGGSPQVWNTSMAFFQGALLAGYLYAHLLARIADMRIQVAIHVLVLAGAWFVLPLQVTHAFGAPSSEHPALWLIGVLTLSVGAPFAAASATAPLLQAWYARTGRADAHDPYYLYAASNLGSFFGLAAYPLLIEPIFGAQAQSAAWSAAYLCVGAIIAIAGATALSANGAAPKPAASEAAPPTWRQRLYWIAAAAVPSALSLGVTLHISTDVASAPFLWVIPLALYLLTFVIAFARGMDKVREATLFLHPLALALLLISYYAGEDWLISMSLILVGFFLSALVCHFALSRARPSADRLTEFYFYVSLGGVLGGAFAALLAPTIFNNVYEYPLALAAACLFRPRAEHSFSRAQDALFAAAAAVAGLALALIIYGPLAAALILAALGAAAAAFAAGWAGEERPHVLRMAGLAVAGLHAILVLYVGFNAADIFTRVPGSLRFETAAPWGALLLASSFAVLTFAVYAIVQPRHARSRIEDSANGVAIFSVLMLFMLVTAAPRMEASFLTLTSLALCAIAVFVNRGRPLLLAIIVASAFLLYFADDARGGRIITQERSFFGVLRTREVPGATAADGPMQRILLHGTTIHGAQLVAPELSRLPLTYYNHNTALGEAILGGLLAHERARLALIGLGAGSTACLMRPEDDLTIYEIDPLVVRLATRPDGDFTFVSQCQPDARVEIGDARLQIAAAPDGAFDVVVVDAFSSDAIPAHLLTREAVALYLRKTSARGIVVLHLSNRNLALTAEAARVARDLNAPTLYRLSESVKTPYFNGALGASVMILANRPETLATLPLASRGDWRVLPAPEGRAWSDDYVNVARALWDNMRGAEDCLIRPGLKRCEGE